MKNFYVPLSESTIRALVRLAAQQRRHPKQQAALILERYLSRKRWLDDPTQQGRLLGCEGDFGSAERFGDGGAASELRTSQRSMYMHSSPIFGGLALRCCAVGVRV
ncbi:MAG: hypothetical protein RML84_11220 [Anaerolineae bacterium]|nr:hypothetical protein [Anaerolineae bacterium]